MGVTYQESVRMRKVQPMTKEETLSYYESGGRNIPERFSNSEEARRERITAEYSPYQIHTERNSR